MNCSMINKKKFNAHNFESDDCMDGIYYAEMKW